MRNARFFRAGILSLLSIFIFACAARAEPTPRSDAAEAERRGGVVLVLSGGGTKGIAHVGVLKVLEEQNIPIVGIVGTSIGAVIGGLYATGYTADELRELILGTNIMGLLADAGTRMRPDAGDHRPKGESAKLYHLNFTKEFKIAGPLGVLPANALVSFLSQHTGHIQTTDFDYLPIPFACVAADLGTGDEVIMRNGSLASAIRASASIPGLLDPWPLDGKLLVDGGLVANLPVGIAKDIFPGYPVIAVNLAGPSIAKPNDRFKSVADVLSQTIDIMTLDRLRRDEAQADLLIYPDVSEFSMLEGAGYERIYERGLKAARDSVEGIAALSGKAPPPALARPLEQVKRTVRGIRVEGLAERSARDIVKRYDSWIGEVYDADLVKEATDHLMKREDIATVDIDTYPASSGEPGDVDVVFSFEKRPSYEIALDGYTSSLHPHRWLALQGTARDLATMGDSLNIEGRVGGDNEWGTQLRYFTPFSEGGQWGVAFNARRDTYSPDGMESHQVERYAARAMYYREKEDRRFGYGVAGEHTNVPGNFESFVWGPYLYYNIDTLDNALVPTKGLSLNSQVWWNTENIFVSRTYATGYIPWSSPGLHFVLNVGLETGNKAHQAYRPLLGDQEELYSLARHPYAGDQIAWARIGVGRNFYNSWWGALRGEIFGTYGVAMEDWDRTRDAWELGLALSVPGQFLNGKIILVYDDGGELVTGFTLGIPRWWGSPLP